MSVGLSWMSASEASRLLGVRRATLYAYVSRGYVRSQPSVGSTRERVYARDDVTRLRERNENRRTPGQAAARALTWGLPVLESSIALIDGRRLYYRGLDAVVLARSRSLEEIASLVWTGQLDAPPSTMVDADHVMPQPPAGPFVTRAQILLSMAAAADPHAYDVKPTGVTSTGRRILQILTLAATGSRSRDVPIAALLGRAWNAGAKGIDVIRAALVLCADHELNVSSFTARCVASAGSHPYAVVIAGLAALEGPRHGGAGARVESMLASMRGARSLRAAFSERLRRGESVDGFGHPLYREGDPRARALLDLLRERDGKSAEYRFVAQVARAASAATREAPNLDFGLAAVARVLRLPAEAPLMLFAIGRSVGWIGHAIEQYATGQLIRPRARYVGIVPDTGVVSHRR